MRTTLTLDDELLKKAHELTGEADRGRLIHEGLTLLIQREAARRLARLGGSAPDFMAPPRRRPPPAAPRVRRPASKAKSSSGTVP